MLKKRAFKDREESKQGVGGSTIFDEEQGVTPPTTRRLRLD